MVNEEKLHRFLLGTLTVGKRVGWLESFGRELDMSCAVELEHHAPANHVAQNAVGLPPVPCLAEKFREGPPAGRGVFGYEIVDECNVLACDGFAAIAKELFHGGRSIAWEFVERKGLDRFFLSPLHRHLPPCWRNTRLLRIAVPQEHLELVDLKR